MARLAARVLCIGTLTLLPTAAALAAPAQLRGKAVVISWNEQRRERNPVTKEERTLNTPFTFTVYVGTNDRMFNRLTAGRMGASDQTAGAKDQTGFAARAVNFTGTRMTATNTFSRGGARQISASFDPSFGSCSGSVVIGLGGGGTLLQKKLGGGMVEVLSATPGSVSCSVSAGNPFGQ